MDIFGVRSDATFTPMPPRDSLGTAACATAFKRGLPDFFMLDTQPPEFSQMTTEYMAWVAKFAAISLALSFITQSPDLRAQASVPAPHAGPPPAATEAPQLTSEDASAFFDGMIPPLIRYADIPGAMIVIVRNGALVLAKGYGYADVQTRRRILPETTEFRIGSISKTFTWTAVMQLVEQGRLDLDRDINQYLDFKVPPAFGKPITLRDLMTHTAGFQDGLKDAFPRTRLTPLGEFLRNNIPARIFPPGSIVAYSNYGAALAGYIVQRASGEPFDRYVAEHIYAPIGMMRSTFDQPLPPALERDASKGYSVGSDPPRPFELMNIWPAGSMVTDGVDMSRWMITHLNGGEYAGHQILSPTTARLMQARAYTPDGSADANGMTLGFWEESRNGHRVIAHSGDVLGTHSYMWLLPNDHIGMFLVFNADSNGTAYANYLRRVAVFRQFMDRYFPLSEPPFPPALRSAAEDGRRLAGHYWSSRRSQTNFLSLSYFPSEVTASVDSRGILRVGFLKGLSGAPMRWREIGPYMWHALDGPFHLGAIRDPRGRIEYLTTDFIPPVLVLQPVPFRFDKSIDYPLLWITLAALLGALLFPPLFGLLRRVYAGCRAEGATHRYYPTTALMLLDLVFLVGWGAVLFVVADQTVGFNGPLEPYLDVLRILGWLSLVGSVYILAASWQTLRRPGVSSWRKLICALAIIGALGTDWFAIVFHLLLFSSTY
jgi:CubicO group peptidase (beta-lactamase class C family)